MSAMHHGRAFSLHTFFPTGEPAGLRILEKDNWSGRAIAFPRARIADVRNVSELSGVGVYVLRGADDASDSIAHIYIGESDDLLRRFNQHTSELDFWTDAVGFTSKDANLNKGHVLYLEARLIELAVVASRCALENTQRRAAQDVRLSPAERANMETFLENALICLRALAVPEFEPINVRPRNSETSAAGDSDGTEFKLAGKDVSATAIWGKDGFVVLAGSTAVQEVAQSFATRPEFSGYRKLRDELLSAGILAGSGTVYKFTKDHVFKRPTPASAIILGNSTSGLTSWRDGAGKTIKEREATSSSGGDRQAPDDHSLIDKDTAK